MKTVSDVEEERMFTCRIVLENRRGEQREFEEATKYTHNDDGTKTVAYIPQDTDNELREQESEEFGLDWKLVEMVSMNVSWDGPFSG